MPHTKIFYLTSLRNSFFGRIVVESKVCSACKRSQTNAVVIAFLFHVVISQQCLFLTDFLFWSIFDETTLQLSLVLVFLLPFVRGAKLCIPFGCVTLYQATTETKTQQSTEKFNAITITHRVNEQNKKISQNQPRAQMVIQHIPRQNNLRLFIIVEGRCKNKK